MEAMTLSRILDIYYNHSPWQDFFSSMIKKEDGLTKAFTLYFSTNNLMGESFSLERQGSILYKFIKENYPDHINKLKIEWILIGLSPQKLEGLRFEKFVDDGLNKIKIIKGSTTTNMRFHFTELDNCFHVFGFDRSIVQNKPIYYAIINKTNF